ncbi:hydantoinase/oxoprolinase family protein [Komagataeibacter sp. FNDCF1]|uniref:hydantoinase/oxoprolinase family protein n=1 Tax=Komagataeibacter sp. FNDCF1 TaxID=2878681 RepID=UPI001E472EFB|nr:hydantoinase/oxoprolinase family protein [Komagataeibacter sp. FNDCF1]MCE2563314.1 hydantoinase/oxoprolinase family protein [Komagataeibacter sp. FNDCF1]
MTSAQQSYRVGVDIGGTFTDVALEHNGHLFSTKILTDYGGPERAILKGLQIVCDNAGIPLNRIDVIVHGTTLATNALIERSGAKTAFITTAGFRDVLEMRTENRFEQYDLNITLPPALIDRADRLVVRERMDADGQVLLPLDAQSVAEVVEQVAARGYESVAIGLLHAYANGAHEVQVRDALLQRCPDLSVSISSEVAPQFREFERFNTVCANAYVKPVIKSYLDRLVLALRELGIGCPVYMIHSGGGIIALEHAAEFPVRLVESGPAGGVIFAQDVARRHGCASVVSFDMGGTTAKICLVENYAPKTAKTFEVARTYRFRKGSGMPISIPVVEMVEIGAGGGSIASVDALRQVRVGPRSAGSEPGPACYQRGGTEPTVTDANLLLGKLDPDNFAGGSLALSPPDAGEAVDRKIASAINVDTDTAAYGIVEMVDENMANAARVHAVENGKDIGEFTMITFGGGGPLHAARLCEKLGIDSFVVPPGAGVGSAIGFLRAPFGYETVRSSRISLASYDAAAVRRLLEGMREEVLNFVASMESDSRTTFECTAFMRYVGQGWDIPVRLPPEVFELGDVARIAESFRQAYAAFFGRTIDGLDMEIVSWSFRASTPTVESARVPPPSETRQVTATASRRLFDQASRTFVDAAVIERESLKPGDRISGPAVIVEPETGTIITSPFDAVIQADGCILATRR